MRKRRVKNPQESEIVEEMCWILQQDVNPEIVKIIKKHQEVPTTSIASNNKRHICTPVYLEKDLYDPVEFLNYGIFFKVFCLFIISE